ncbi:MAG: glutaredoxin family protein [Anaerolineales bacterium]|nr:glutaredoxin family protein [Anaerolineales bacterium]
MLRVTLYTKVGCHLCEDVKAELAALRALYPHELVEVDITQDDALYGRYRYTIPVLHIGTSVLHAPIDRTQLIHALQQG